MRLTKALNAWQSPDFEGVLKDEIEHLDVEALPLQQGLSRGGYASGENLSAMVIGVSEEPGMIRAKVGIHYTSIIAGCSCADDPTPVDEISEYCEVQLDIDCTTAETTISLLVG